jgi:hypothetical protein
MRKLTIATLIFTLLISLTPNTYAGCPYPIVNEGYVTNYNLACNFPELTTTYWHRSNDIIEWPEGSRTLMALVPAASCLNDGVFIARWWSTMVDEDNHLLSVYWNQAGWYPKINPAEKHQTDIQSDSGCARSKPSPIFVAFENNLDLTSAENGVSFDLESSGYPLQLGWLPENSANAWIIRGTNPANGSSLFGNLNTQAPALYANEEESGYRAFRLLDTNGDKQISSADAVWSELNLWFDSNKNGVGDSGEIVPLSSRLSSFSLKYKLSSRRDSNGNSLRFRSEVTLLDGTKKLSYDVFPAVKETTTPIITINY